jgi:hypothetical protein
MSLKPFDPSVYDRSHVDFQNEPDLSAEKWTGRFVAHMKKLAEKLAAPDFLAEMDDYARDCAPSYLEDRKEYATPEEAAETDVSYWENEE